MVAASASNVRTVLDSRVAVRAVQAVVLVAVVLLLIPWFDAPGPPMDEGALLTYADRVMAGDVLIRDLQSFYGPLNAYLTGAVFHVAGESLFAERLLGLMYRIALVGGLLVMIRRRGPLGIALGGLAMISVLPQEGVAAYASFGALACSCWAIAFASDDRAVLAGVAAAAAALMRFDWAVPLIAASIPFLVRWRWRERARVLAVACTGALAYLVYFSFVGWSNTAAAFRQLREGQAGRGIPTPYWPSYLGSLLALTLVFVVMLLVLGVRRWRSQDGPMFISVALFGGALFPYELVRLDAAHIVVASVVPLAVGASALPLLATELATPLQRLRRPVRIALLVAVALLAVEPFTRSPLQPKPSYAVSNDGRSFRLADSGVPRQAERAIRLADRLAPAGSGLFVGPLDLRRTTYADSYMYFLLPRLRPATYYVTLDPGITAGPRHALAGELGRARVLILNRQYDRVTEHNASRAFGTPRPNRVVARLFCRRGDFRPYVVLVNCRGHTRS